MALPEQFSLRWNDFHSNLSQSFQALLEGEDLVDVTLAAGGQFVYAHKLILSVCSPYFKEIFKNNPCEHPIVILKDVSFQELRQLLQFMYRGEVHVRQQDLSGFLQSAEHLQIKGLTGSRERSQSPPAPPPPAAEEGRPQQAPPPPPQHCTPASEPNSESPPEWIPGGEDTIATESLPESDTNTQEEATRSPLKRLLKNTSNKNSYNSKKKSRPANDSPTHPENSDYAYDGEPLIDFDNDLFHSVMVLPESAKESGWNIKTGGVKCPSCHRFFANRYNLKVHIRDKHDTREGTLQCDICHKRMRNPSCLRVHMYHHRKQAAYLAQLSSQGDQMKHVVQNMVKWRTEGAAGNADYREADNSSWDVNQHRYVFLNSAGQITYNVTLPTSIEFTWQSGAPREQSPATSEDLLRSESASPFSSLTAETTPSSTPTTSLSPMTSPSLPSTPLSSPPMSPPLSLSLSPPPSLSMSLSPLPSWPTTPQHSRKMND